MVVNSHKFLMTKRRKKFLCCWKYHSGEYACELFKCKISLVNGILISRSLFTSLFKSCFRCDFCGSSIASPSLFVRFVCSGLFESYTPLNLPSLGIAYSSRSNCIED